MTPLILHASAFTSPTGGNFIASLRGLASACTKAGLDTLLAFPREAAARPWSTELAADGFKVCFLPPLSAGIAERTRALHSLTRGNREMLIHTHFTDYDVPAWLAITLAARQRRRPRVLWHLHSDFPVRMTPVRRLKNLLKFKLMGATAQLVAVSEPLQLQAITSGMNSRLTAIIPNGVDFSRLGHSTRSPDQVLRDLHIPVSTPLILLFGWSPHVKGVDVALDAVEELVRQGEPVILAVVGTDVLRAYIDTRFPRPPGWLRVIPPSDRVADLFRAASLFVSASRHEGLPYSVIEAMGCGTPVVLSDIPAMAWAHDAPGASFFPSGDPLALAAKIRQSLACPPILRRRQARESAMLVAKRFDLSLWSERILAVYKERLEAGTC